MTSATEKLCRLLDERGAKYERTEDDTTIYYDSDGNRYTYNVNPDSGWAQLFGYNLTPERAIAATLGEQRDTADIDELLDEFEHECFMIRVEASETRAKDGVVREAYKRQREETAQAIAATLGSESVDYMLNTIGKLEEENERLRSSCGTLTAEQVRDALMSADRWGKPMGNTGLTNTHVVIRDDGWQAIADELNAAMGGGECIPHGEWESISQTQEVRHVYCECGYELGMDRRSSFPFEHTALFAMPNYCQECGRKIRKAVER